MNKKEQDYSGINEFYKGNGRILKYYLHFLLTRKKGNENIVQRKYRENKIKYQNTRAHSLSSQDTNTSP